MSRLYITFLETAVVPLTYEPETEAYLDVIGIVNSVDTTYYSGTAQEITGRAIWTAVDAFVVSLKTSFSLTLGVNNLSTKTFKLEKGFKVVAADVAYFVVALPDTLITVDPFPIIKVSPAYEGLRSIRMRAFSIPLSAI